MRKFTRLIFSIFVISSFLVYSFIPVYADDFVSSDLDSVDSAIRDSFGLYLDIYQSFMSSYNQDVSSMSGDDFYSWYTSNEKTPQATIYHYLNRFVSAEPKYGGGRMPVFGVTIPNESEVEMEKAHYNAAFIDKSFVDFIDDEVRSTSNNEIRFNTLEEISLVTPDLISTSNISVTVRSGGTGEVVKNHGSSWSANTVYDVYYDISQAKTDTEHVSIYTGGELPPLIYIPSGCAVYQDGVKLKTNDFYVVLGDNRLLYTDITYHPNGLIAFDYYTPSGTADSVVFECSHLKFNNNGLPVTERRSGIGYITISGSNVGQVNVSPYKGWSMVDMISKYCNYCLDIDGSISEKTALPSYIPYDLDNVIVILVPDDNDGDIVYMDTNQYTNYVNNGNIVEGDYVNRYNTTTNTDIVNNYNDYVTNINNVGSGGTGSGDIVVYDDTNLLAKLDTILVGLNNIYNTIVNLNFFNFNFITSGGEELPVLSNQPCYDNFTDCITDHVTIVSDVLDVIDSMEPVVSDHQLTFSDMALFPVSKSDDQLWSRFNSTTIDLSWYDEYRLTIRNLLKIPCYILCITACWAAFRQMFGVKPPGGE